MLTEDILKRTEGLPNGHYDPVRLLHLAHIANDQMTLELSHRKAEWDKMVQEATSNQTIGIFTIHSPWFHPDDCFDYLITNIHFDPNSQDENERIFVTQILYCARLYGSRVLESKFRLFRDVDALKEWLNTPNSGFERYVSLEKLMERMAMWLV
ncbi:MAG: hypothetical protein IJ920_10245 [Paludibacteraceae bacterium]|nr:hypothetical protein [Paludibacteraceae bacterium]